MTDEARRSKAAPRLRSLPASGQAGRRWFGRAHHRSSSDCRGARAGHHSRLAVCTPWVVTNSRFGRRTGIPARGFCVSDEMAGRSPRAVPGHSPPPLAPRPPPLATAKQVSHRATLLHA